MSKTLKNSNLSRRSAVRTLAAISLSISLAAFGCTTDRTLGNGDPVTTPGLRTSPTGGASSGSETSPTTPPSMASSSSYTAAQALPPVTRRMQRLSPAEAAAVMAQHQPRVRYLGPAYPGNGGAGYASDAVVTGQFQNPALRTNPQLTLNSSISSQPTSAIASGQGEGAVGGTGGFSGAAFITGTTIASTTGASTVAPGGFTSNATNAGVTAGTGLGLGGNTSGAIFSPTAAGGLSPLAVSGLPLGTTGSINSPTIAPTAFSSFNPPTAISGFPALAANSTMTQAALGNTTPRPISTLGTNTLTNTTGNATNANATLGTNSTSNATTTATTARTTSRIANPVRITRDANGRTVITNANSSIR